MYIQPQYENRGYFINFINISSQFTLDSLKTLSKVFDPELKSTGELYGIHLKTRVRRLLQ